ncbi:MAG: hypothetical protein JW739_01930 [Opitutales bacterium]|nr:hypothetical protein [Opitutales bacterium]
MKTTQKRISLSISLPLELRDAARQAAFDDNRSLSGLIAALLLDYVQREQYLPPVRKSADQSSVTLHR